MTAQTKLPVFGADFSGYATWPKVGSVVSFWCPENGKPTHVVATITTYYGLGENRVFSLAYGDHVFRAKFITKNDRHHIAPIPKGGETPVSYPCRIQALRR